MNFLKKLFNRKKENWSDPNVLNKAILDSVDAIKKEDGEKYWAYLHTNGSIEVKPWYTGNNYINEAKASPYVKCFLQSPISASSMDEAEKIARKHLFK